MMPAGGQCALARTDLIPYTIAIRNGHMQRVTKGSGNGSNVYIVLCPCAKINNPLPSTTLT